MTNDFDIPEHTFGAIRRYVEHRLPPGGFLQAVLANDLTMAMGYADAENKASLPRIVATVNALVPEHARGTYGAVHGWLQGKGTHA